MNNTCMDSVESLLDYLERNGLEGYDPYDALSSPLLKRLKSKWLRIAFTVLFRLSPINLRKIFHVKKGINPKSMGLYLSSYSKLHALGYIRSSESAHNIFKWLCDHSSKGYSGFCWGYNFPWQSRARLLDEGIPTIVNTSFIGHGILDFYDIHKDESALDVARSSCDFILKDLNISKSNGGICFSYTPVEENIVHNANVLGASLLARVYSYTKEDELLDYAKRSFHFTLGYQHKNGMWAYNMQKKTGKERFQTDWHQGFILDSIMWFIQALDSKEEQYENALEIGARFYRNQFRNDAVSYWRWPRKWPVDIHNQAQAIITFSKLNRYIPGSIEIAEKIAEWTIDNMRNKKRGYFYYQRWPFLVNKISYNRWGQAWMLLGLVNLIQVINENN